MKYIVLMANGLTDQPIAEKDNQTPLQLADTPNLDRLTAMGRCGSVRTIPEDLPAGNEISYLSLLGCDPARYNLGAAPYEAKALGLALTDDDTPLCCDFIILQSSHNDMILKDFTAGQLSADNAQLLLGALQEQIPDAVTFHHGAGHHNLMVMKNAALPDRLHPPHELVGEGIRQHMPEGQACKELVYLMNQAQIILHNHPFNQARAKNGDDVVNSVWFWGNGNGKRDLPPAFSERYGKEASVVTASLMLKGMAQSAGMSTPEVQGATGFPDTNYAAKVSAALNELESRDVVFLHVAAAETPSLLGNIDDKMLTLEDIDSEVVGPLLDAVEKDNDLALLLVENHMSSVNLMRYTKDPVPFVVYPSTQGADAVERFNEEVVKSGAEHFKSGSELIEAFLQGRL
ncbi:MAG: 2,3-bisphosphoglycerate-independent phosphoglycerate mutase [Nitrospinota bacterium]|nr:2,3-bisphosphoglycerate-independent phosphoglycerate mutase [Nitrospinota bacterium]